MAVVRLLGEHISYSASPAMQAAAFAALGTDHQYELVDVAPDDLAMQLRLLRMPDVLGANVTVPFKSAVIPMLDEIEPLALRANAVNTIVNHDGRLIGSNTDVPAIRDEIARLYNAPGRAVILGAGGAARAVAVALEDLASAAPTLISRSDWVDLPALLADADLLVNATPVGTNSDESPVDNSFLNAPLAVLDLVYRPSPTRLVHDARACGLEARAGAGVLLGQGWRSLEAWLGVGVSDDIKRAMADAVAAELGNGADV
jgi:shikimate dehydrogenase